MKKLCLILAYLFLFTQTASAMPLLVGQKVVYRGTITGLRIGAADGGDGSVFKALVDNLSGTLAITNSPLLHTGALTQANTRISAAATFAFIDTNDATFATNLAAHLGKYLVIKDSAGKKAYAWIKAAGTSETLSETELIGDPGFNDEGYWGKNTGWSVVGGVAVGTTVPNGNVIYKSGLLTAGARYRVSGDFTRDAGSYAFFVGNLLSTMWNAAATRSYDVTSTSSSAIAALSGYLFTGTADNFSVKQVTAPSSSGATLSSTKNGTAMDNWESIETGFNYNDSSGYTYYIYGRDITDIADGNHQIEIYDSSNRMLKGVLKAAGSGVTTSTVYTADFSAGVDGWSANWLTGYEVGSFVWDTDHAVLTVAGNSNSALRPSIVKTLSMTVGALQFLEMDYSVVSGSPIITGESIGGVTITSLPNTLSGTDTYITSQQTCAGPNYNKLVLYFNGRDYDFVLNINAVRIKAVTAPSSSGCTIVSAKGGEVYNFSYKNASFTYNASSYYVIIRAIR